MQVTLLKNLIFDGVFYRAGETADIPDNQIAPLTRRGFLEGFKTVNGTNSAQIDSVDDIAELPPLDTGRKRK